MYALQTRVAMDPQLDSPLQRGCAPEIKDLCNSIPPAESFLLTGCLTRKKSEVLRFACLSMHGHGFQSSPYLFILGLPNLQCLPILLLTLSVWIHISNNAVHGPFLRMLLPGIIICRLFSGGQGDSLALR